jgi:hypothetical protein
LSVFGCWGKPSPRCNPPWAALRCPFERAHAPQRSQLTAPGSTVAWADGRFVEAKQIFRRDYPEDAGFKVTDLIEIPDPYAP